MAVLLGERKEYSEVERSDDDVADVELSQRLGRLTMSRNRLYHEMVGVNRITQHAFVLSGCS
jgi:hypothetical protein